MMDKKILSLTYGQKRKSHEKTVVIKHISISDTSWIGYLGSLVFNNKSFQSCCCRFWRKWGSKWVMWTTDQQDACSRCRWRCGFSNVERLVIAEVCAQDCEVRCWLCSPSSKKTKKSCLINTEPSLDSHHSRELSSDCMPTPGDGLLYSRMQMRSHLGQKPWLAILVFLEPEGEGFSCGLADYTLLHGIPPPEMFP